MLLPDPHPHARLPACGVIFQSDLRPPFGDRLPLVQGSWGRSPCAGGVGGVPPDFSFSFERSSAKAMRSALLRRIVVVQH
jgi:hypothetical protein